ncbi:hypothetical protein BB561_005863 [Smittium simulii]|uniref:Dihydrofolate reductase n=1 Tax=Smittium simulii TaxID=133385 RepID=A0A2T9Y7X6_9FUNG|nr:hypothetical protein BB561_006951 [Smittium simulii]PVU88433.1 hypothetical protein BB561_005863 [Smittium simulii]
MTLPSPINIVAAIDQNYGIGLDNDIPWYIPEDLVYFNKLTKTGINVPQSDIANSESDNSMSVCIMGRKTWESLPDKYRPLPGRFNIILSSKQNLIDLNNTRYKNVRIASSIKQAISLVHEINQSTTSIKLGSVFIVGGSNIYEQALLEPRYRLFITHVKNPSKKNCTVFFPQFLNRDGINQKHFNDLKSLLYFDIEPGKLVSKSGIEYEFTLYQNF